MDPNDQPMKKRMKINKGKAPIVTKGKTEPEKKLSGRSFRVLKG